MWTLKCWCWNSRRNSREYPTRYQCKKGLPEWSSICSVIEAKNWQVRPHKTKRLLLYNKGKTQLLEEEAQKGRGCVPAAYLNREFSEVRVAKKYLKNCLTTSEMKDVQIKTTLRFHLTPVRMAYGQENSWQIMMVKTQGVGPFVTVGSITGWSPLCIYSHFEISMQT